MALKNQLTTSDYLTYKEFKRLLSSLRKDNLIIWETFARISFYTACRASDVLNLKWENIYGQKNVVICEKKTQKAREIQFSDEVMAIIGELYELLGKPKLDMHIFRNPETDKPYTIQAVNKRLKVFKRKYQLDIGNFSTHTFRKTFGRYVYEHHNRSAESLILLNHILRHSTIEVTKRYIGLQQDEINDIYASIKF